MALDSGRGGPLGCLRAGATLLPGHKCAGPIGISFDALTAASHSINNSPRFLSPSPVSIAENKRRRSMSQGLILIHVENEDHIFILQIPADGRVMTGAVAEDLLAIEIDDVPVPGIVCAPHMVTKFFRGQISENRYFALGFRLSQFGKLIQR